MSLRDFLKKMDNEDEVLHVRNEVSTRFEIAYVMKSFDNEGPILLFEKVKDFDTSVVGNISGTRKRLCTALDVDQTELYKKLADSWRFPSKPRTIRDGAVNECAEENVNLAKIPVLKHFERDAGQYVTSAIVHARSPDGTIENVSVHRLQVLDKKHLIIRLVPRHLFNLWRMAKDVGKDLEVAISIGVHPAILLASSSPLPFGLCEYAAANSLLGGRLKLIECAHVDACAPSDAELVLEGKISASVEAPEGPFVDVTGTYDVQRRQPVIDIVGVMHRKEYVYHALLSSGAEHMIMMGLPHEVLIWEAVSKVVPRVCAVNLSRGGTGWLHAILSIEKQLDGDGKNALLAAFGAHPSLKHAVVVDSDIDAFDISDVEWAVATRFQGGEDLVAIENARGSTLDPSADQEKVLTAKLGFDATRPLGKPKEKFEKARIPVGKNMSNLVRRLRRS